MDLSGHELRGIGSLGKFAFAYSLAVVVVLGMVLVVEGMIAIHEYPSSCLESTIT